MNIPKPTKMNSNTNLLPYVLVEYEAFDAANNPMQPFLGNHSTTAQYIFHYTVDNKIGGMLIWNIKQ